MGLGWHPFVVQFPVALTAVPGGFAVVYFRQGDNDNN